MEEEAAQVKEWSVRDIKTLCLSFNLDISSCFEKGDLIGMACCLEYTVHCFVTLAVSHQHHHIPSLLPPDSAVVLSLSLLPDSRRALPLLPPS
jgi:hypothetical protein